MQLHVCDHRQYFDVFFFINTNYRRFNNIPLYYFYYMHIDGYTSYYPRYPNEGQHLVTTRRYPTRGYFRVYLHHHLVRSSQHGTETCSLFRHYHIQENTRHSHIHNL